MKVQFLFFGEGSSDSALVPVLEDVCVMLGATEATGISPDLERLPKLGKSVRARLNTIMKIGFEADFIFYHRDADSVDPTPSYQNIRQEQKRWDGPRIDLIPVVPIQETEAWALLDEPGKAITKPADRVISAARERFKG